MALNKNVRIIRMITDIFESSVKLYQIDTKCIQSFSFNGGEYQ
ncbi:hypothetical protein BH23BAC1_BH23BAC1_37250 [soil metagenome]